MPPKGSKEDETGLLEYLEDIIGTSIYKADLNEMNTILETNLETKQTKFLDVCKIKDLLSDLESDKNKAIDHLNKHHMFF